MSGVSTEPPNTAPSGPDHNNIPLQFTPVKKQYPVFCLEVIAGAILCNTTTVWGVLRTAWYISHLFLIVQNDQIHPKYTQLWVFCFSILCFNMSPIYHTSFLFCFLPVMVNFSLVMTTSSSSAANSTLPPSLLRTSSLWHWASTTSGPAKTRMIWAFDQRQLDQPNVSSN